jgi:hypothetical protein
MNMLLIHLYHEIWGSVAMNICALLGYNAMWSHTCYRGTCCLYLHISEDDDNRFLWNVGNYL